VSRRLIWNGFKYLLALGLLTYVVWSNWSPKSKAGEPLPGLKDVWEAHIVQGRPIHSDFLLLAAGVGLAAVLLTFLRWYYLVRAQGLPFTMTNALRLGLIGFYFSIFLPGSVGGDIIKAAFIARGQSRRTVAVATVILDRVIALWALVWFVALLGGFFWLTGSLEGAVGNRLQTIVVGAASMVGLSLLLCLLLAVLPARRARRFAFRLSRIPKVGHAAAEFWRAVWMYRRKPKSVLLALLLALVGHVGFVLAFYFSARTLWDADQIPAWHEHFLVVPIGMIIQAAPLFPGGAGIGEAGYGWLYQLLDYPVRSGVLASLVQRVIYWVLGLAGYLIYLRMKPDLQPVTDVTGTELAPVRV
jgi:glycosyltransferase 2 family protein